MVLGPIGAGSLGTLLVKIGADFNDLNKGLNKAANNVEKKSLQMAQATKIAKQAMLGLGIAVTVAAGFAIKAAIDFESAFAGVRKTVDATEKEFKELREELIRLSQEIPVSAVQLAKIQEIAGQLGIRGVASLTKFTDAVAKIAVTTNLTQEAAAIGFARIAAVIGEPIENIDQMASAVVDLGNKFEVNEAEIITFSQRIAGMGKVAKLTVDELFGIGAAFASVGIQAEAGGTAVNKVLLELQKQGKTGGEAFIEFVANLEEQGDKAAFVLEDLGFKQARTQRAFLSLAGAGGKLAEAMGIANVAFEENVALNEEAAKRFETTASQIQLTKNNITALNIEIGDKLLPLLQDLLISINHTIDGFDILFRILNRETALPSLEQSLVNQIELINQQIIAQQDLVGSILLTATEREEAEERLNLLIERRSELFEALLEVRSRVAEEAATIEQEKEDNITGIVTAGMEDRKKLIEELAKITTKRFSKLATDISGAFSNALSDLILNASTAKEAFQSLGEAIVKIIVDFIAQTIISATIGKALQAAATAAGVAQAVVLANAWAPAAALASLATAGGNAVPAAAGMTSVAALAQSIAALAGLGLQEGADIIPARLAPGEMVVPATFADAIRAGRLVLSGPGAMGGNGEVSRSVSFGDIEINVAGNLDEDTAPDIIEQIITQIGVQTETEGRGA